MPMFGTVGRDVQIGLVEAALIQLRVVLGKHSHDGLTASLVHIHMRWHNNKIRADGSSDKFSHGRSHAELACFIASRQQNAMSNGKACTSKFRPPLELHSCIKHVHVTVQDRPRQVAFPLKFGDESRHMLLCMRARFVAGELPERSISSLQHALYAPCHCLVPSALVLIELGPFRYIVDATWILLASCPTHVRVRTERTHTYPSIHFLCLCICFNARLVARWATHATVKASVIVPRSRSLEVGCPSRHRHRRLRRFVSDAKAWWCQCGWHSAKNMLRHA